VRTDHPLPHLSSSSRVSTARGLDLALPAPVRILCKSTIHGAIQRASLRLDVQIAVAPGWSYSDNRVLGLVLQASRGLECVLWHHSGIMCPEKHIIDSRIMHERRDPRPFDLVQRWPARACPPCKARLRPHRGVWSRAARPASYRPRGRVPLERIGPLCRSQRHRRPVLLRTYKLRVKTVTSEARNGQKTTPGVGAQP
jgi:hypothetical protein